MQRDRNPDAVSSDSAPTINRFAVILRPAQAYFDWTQSCPDPNPATTLESLQGESTVYLVPDTGRAPGECVKKHFWRLFAAELAAWHLDESYWPKDLSFAAFCEFFEVQVASCVFDFGKGQIVKEDEDA
jgi:hypothetical protein